MFRTILEYECSLLDPHRRIDINSLERVQKGDISFVTGNYCIKYGNLDLYLKTLGWDTLEERRMKGKH